MDATQALDPPVPVISSRPTSDPPLLPVAAGAGGATADFDEIYRSSYNGLVRLAFVLVDTDAEAEEIVQEAFARALSRWHRLDNPGAYLRRAVVNGCRDLQRRRYVRRRQPPEVAPEVHAHDHVLDAIRALRPPQAAVVILRFYEDLTVDQIAEVLGLRPGTVKSHLHRALTQLKKVVEP